MSKYERIAGDDEAVHDVSHFVWAPETTSDELERFVTLGDAV